MTEYFYCLLNVSTTVAETAAEVVQSVDGWVQFGRFADILGVGSVLLSIATFFVAKIHKNAQKMPRNPICADESFMVNCTRQIM